MSAFDYNQVATIPRSLLDAGIREYFPSITQDDIDNGVIIRYFVRQANHRVGEITEINRSTYERLQGNNLYNSISLKWRIAGPLDDIAGPQHANSPTRLFTGVLTANRLAVEEADRNLPGMETKILNFTQFYQFDRRAQ